MRRFLVVGGFISAVTMVSVTAAVGAGAPRPLATGAEVTELARGTLGTAGKVPVELGQNAVMQTITLEPGSAVGWHQQPDDAVFIVTKGMATSYTSCTDKEMWHADQAYLQTASGGPHLIKNEGTAPAELVAVFSKVPGVGSPFVSADAPGGCALGGDLGTVAELGRGAAYSGETFDVNAAENVVVQRFVLAPGFTTTWHLHPGPNLVIQLKGEAVNYTGCDDPELWTPGNTYIHVPSEHYNNKSGHANMTRNETDQPSELLAVFFNVPNDPQHPKGVTPIKPLQPAPSDCPTMMY